MLALGLGVLYTEGSFVASSLLPPQHHPSPEHSSDSQSLLADKIFQFYLNGRVGRAWTGRQAPRYRDVRRLGKWGPGPGVRGASHGEGPRALVRLRPQWGEPTEDLSPSNQTEKDTDPSTDWLIVLSIQGAFKWVRRWESSTCLKILKLMFEQKISNLIEVFQIWKKFLKLHP